MLAHRPRPVARNEGKLDMTEIDAETLFLVVLVQHGIQPDVLELLAHGGALRAAIRATTYTEPTQELIERENDAAFAKGWDAGKTAAAKALDKYSYEGCERGQVDYSTGVYECRKEARGECNCYEFSEAKEAIMALEPRFALF